MREIVLDTETIGFDPLGGHRIVEIGAVELVNRYPTGQTFHPSAARCANSMDTWRQIIETAGLCVRGRGVGAGMHLAALDQSDGRIDSVVHFHPRAKIVLVLVASALFALTEYLENV
jgi:DNA polymerase III epsilon subunit-like protein